jgi:precorrin 3B synthase CobZ
MDLPLECDVLVAGSGNAGFSAAIAAAQAGARRVLLIDKCPEDWAGGNTYFTAGAYRTVHDGLSDLLPIVNNVDEDLAKRIDLQPYSENDFADDLQRICIGRSNAELSKILIKDSNSAIKWLARNGIRFQLSFNRQAYEVDGRFKFWGGLHIKTQDGGKGLIEDYKAAARKNGVMVSWSTPLTGIVANEKVGDAVYARVQYKGEDKVIKADAVILAAGGFESNPRMRCQYLGPGWDMAMVRGTPYNTGECLEIAMRDISAKPAGNWSGCHSVAWDANAGPDVGDREASNEYTKSGYPLGIMINVEGKRFVDEGIDLRNYTYAKFGRAILAQPEHIAFQIWDSKMSPWLRDEEYRKERVERITADTIEELADKCMLRGLRDGEGFVNTLQEYNEAVYAHRKENPTFTWNPAVRDGLSTQSSAKKLTLAKSNWALPLDQGPFLAVKVTCGVTFTFGGLAVHPQTAQLINATTGDEIPGIFCVGEMLGGLFYQNYPGGSGLTSGVVFGRRAGYAAGKLASHPASNIPAEYEIPAKL